MQLTLEVPQSLVRKLKALHLLLPEDSSESFEDIVIGLLDASAKDAIAEIISHQDDESTFVDETSPGLEDTRTDDYRTVTELGDEDDTEDDEEEMGQRLSDVEALVPKTGGLTEADLENDMRVSDPESEAVFDGSGSEDEYDRAAEDLFTSKMNMPTQSKRDPRIQRRLDHQRNLAKKRRGKVSLFSGSEEATI